MNFRFAFAAALVCLLTLRSTADIFGPTAGNQSWDVNANWDTNSVPNASGAVAVIQAATAALTIDLGQPITVGSLAVNKSSGNFATTIGVGTTNTLTFDGGTSTLSNGLSAAATGQTTIAAPVIFNAPFTISQTGANMLQLTGGMSGTGNLILNRDSNGSGVVTLSGASTYGGTTSLTGSAADDFLIVRLDNANAIPASSNISLANSSILELAADNFTRPLSGTGQITFAGSGRNGWGAVGQEREINLGGNLDPVTWGSTAGQANFGQLVLGVATSTATVNFRNPLNIGSSNRNIRSYDGSAVVDGKISGVISGTAGITKIGDGALSFAAANTYSGNTVVQGGILRLDHQDALPAAGNLQLGSGSQLAIGADTTPGDPNSDFARTLGTGAGQIQLTNIGTGPNQANSGFAAYGGTRSVVLNGGAMLTWNSGSFLSGGTGTVNRNFILGADNADITSTLDFKNPIDLNGATRTVVTKQGAALIDARLSGVLSGNATAGLLKDNPGTLELSAANTYGGPTTIFAGVLLLTNAQSIPGGIAGGNANTILFTSTNENNMGNLGLGQGDLTSTLSSAGGAGTVNLGTVASFAAYTTDRAVNFKEGGNTQQVVWGTNGFVTGALGMSAIDANATIDLQNPIDLNAAARKVKVLNGTANIDGKLSGVLSGAGGSLNKDGGGTLQLTGANTYDGGTTVTLGRLLVSNTSGSGTGTGPVNVNAGTLGGTGSISGLVTVNSGAHIAPGESIESLNVGSLTVAAGSFLDFELGAPGSPGVTSDLINVLDSGGLTLNGGTVTLTNAGGLSSGTYTLIDYAGTLGGSVGNLALGTVPAGFSFALVDNPTNTSVDLQVVLQGDYNGNGAVDTADYVVWRTQNGQSGTGLAADGDGNGTVNDLDFDYWRARYGNTGGSGAGSSLAGNQAVPEPATSAMLALAIPFLCWRKFKWIRV